VIKHHKVHLWVLATAAMASLLLVPVTSAAIVGTLNTTNCTNGGVIVTATTIDFFNDPAITPQTFGCIVGSASSTAPNVLTFGSGTPFAGDANGNIQNLTTPAGQFTGSPVPDFMVFTSGGTGIGTDTLHFDLTELGPGVSNTNCSLPGPCSVVAGSPFILLGTSTGTTVTLDASGFAHDSLSPTDLSTFSGAFTTQIAGSTPSEIQTAATTGTGAVTAGSTVSGQFIVTAGTPEPVSMALIGGGLIGLALLRRRRRQV
jgi:hypothetical protein